MISRHKDQAKNEKFRPITLMDANKTKAPANKIQKYIKMLVSHDWPGFISITYDQFNGKKNYIIHHIER